MPDPRSQRIAENESRFRDINERLEGDLRRIEVGDDPVEFVCECGHADCAAPVALTVAEYERVRQDPAMFALVPGHEIPDAEDVVARTDRHLVVRKHAETQPIVEARDPRADG